MRLFVIILGISLSGLPAHAADKGCTEKALSLSLNTIESRISYCKAQMKNNDILIKDMTTKRNEMGVVAGGSTALASISLAGLLALTVGGDVMVMGLIAQEPPAWLIVSLSTAAAGTIIYNTANEAPVEIPPDEAAKGELPLVSTSEIRSSLNRYIGNFSSAHTENARLSEDQRKTDKKWYKLGWDDVNYMTSFIDEARRDSDLYKTEIEKLTKLRKRIGEICSTVDQLASHRVGPASTKEH